MRHGPTSTACVFSIAYNDPRDEVHYFDVICWGKVAESAGKYLNKGRQIGVSGSLQHDRWETNEGEKRSKVVISAYNIQFLGGKRDEDRELAASVSSSDDDIPF